MFTVTIGKKTELTEKEITGMELVAESQRGKRTYCSPLRYWIRFGFNDETRAKFFADTMCAVGRYSVALHVAS